MSEQKNNSGALFKNDKKETDKNLGKFLKQFPKSEFVDDFKEINAFAKGGDIKATSEYTYNEFQLNLFVNAEGFVGISGGSTLLLNLFQKPTITYLYNSSDLRPKFWENENGIKNIKNYYSHRNILNL